jgi:glutamyl-tRNA reductase
MNINRPENISDFFVAGISYKKTDAALRGKFAISNNQYENILKNAPSFNVHSLFVLSTCNRTEIYGFADNASRLVNLLCSQTDGSAADFTRVAYIKNGNQAIEHLFDVGAGLDSQILGDYEIVGQLKQAVQFAREHHFINSFIDRLVNSVLKSSKSVKNETCLSGGTVSVSFAAVQYIKDKISGIAHKNILLVGTGKIGRNTCKNMVDYLGTTNITLINRTEQKAAELANELHLKYASMDTLAAEINAADIILTATSAPEPTILLKHVEHGRKKLIIDLSIPYSTEAGIGQLPNVQLVNVDMLSELKDNALKKRKAEIPLARRIIKQHIVEFMEWNSMRKNAPTLQAIKLMLNEIALIHQRELQNPQTNCPYIAAEQKIRQVMNGIADKMRNDKQQGCYYIEAINDYINRSVI